MTYTVLKTFVILLSVGMGVVTLKQKQTEQSYRMNHMFRLESVFNNRLAVLRAQVSHITSPLMAKEASEKEKWQILDPYKKIVVYKNRPPSESQPAGIISSPAIVSR